MSDLPTPLERARSLSRDRALTEQADQHAITLESILAVLRSGRLADVAARREATEIASSALIRARSVHEQQESVLEPVAEAFSRGLLVGAGIAAVLAVFAWLRMPAVKVAGGAGGHMHH